MEFNKCIYYLQMIQFNITIIKPTLCRGDQVLHMNEDASSKIRL